MRLDMLAQIGGFGESHTTARVRALEWLLSCVHAHMDRKSGLKGECLATAWFWAFKGLFVRMRSHVLGNSRVSYKNFSWQITVSTYLC